MDYSERAVVRRSRDSGVDVYALGSVIRCETKKTPRGVPRGSYFWGMIPKRHVSRFSYSAPSHRYSTFQTFWYCYLSARRISVCLKATVSAVRLKIHILSLTGSFPYPLHAFLVKEVTSRKDKVLCGSQVTVSKIDGATRPSVLSID